MQSDRRLPWWTTETGEFTEWKLLHEANQVGEFYAALEGPVVVGIEATGRCSGLWISWKSWGRVPARNPVKIRVAGQKNSWSGFRPAEEALRARRQVLVPSSEADYCRFARHPTRSTQSSSILRQEAKRLLALGSLTLHKCDCGIHVSIMTAWTTCGYPKASFSCRPIAVCHIFVC